MPSRTAGILALLIAVTACSPDPIESAQTCDQLMDALGERMDALPDGATIQDELPVWIDAGEKARELLAAGDDLDLGRCETLAQAATNAINQELGRLERINPAVSTSEDTEETP